MAGIVMHWPQWTWVTLMSLTLLAHALRHGEPRKDKHDFWRTAACTALEAARLTDLLDWLDQAQQPQGTTP